MKAKVIPFPIRHCISTIICDRLGGPGNLVCPACGESQRQTAKTIAGHLSAEWPRHCGAPMMWIPEGWPDMKGRNA
jgi:hypothetical protein